ncbi:MAG: FprA family A-type flavoprotein [Elusimicrobia bacterium]|nr:FprA family A-type flavoprotein [Elusimicrobiota bacterium]
MTNSPYKAVKITDKVFWVGAVDWNVRDFHGYSTNRGTTYNAYLILGEYPVLLDTVKYPFKDEMMARISSVIEPQKIKAVISNHSEMDHTGAMAFVIDKIKPEKIIASVMGEKALAAHFHHSWKVTAVKDGETLDLGDDKITFYESRMLHWPDSMVSYLQGAGVLFSNDIFGMHLASDKRFDDEISGWEYEAAKYYANIVLPYSEVVKTFAAKLKQKAVSPKFIAPDHGHIWRKDLGKIIEMYLKWAEQKPANKAVIVYDTMWQSTDLLARSIAEGLIYGGTETKVMPLGSHHRSDVMAEIMCAGALIAGSPTLNKNIFPTMADALIYVKGLSPKNLGGGVFGSYGWGGEAIGQLEDFDMGVAVSKELKNNA